MPLTKLQSELLRLLAAQRDPESYVAGSTPLNWDAPRFSGDIDIFHDREERVALAVAQDCEVLRAKGFSLEWLRREPSFYAVLVKRGQEATRLEWAVDSDFRFFPVRRDDRFGYALHPVDLATNKAMASVGRREPRDVVDLLRVHARVLTLGAVVWAAVGKSLGFTPEGLLNEMRRVANYVEADFRRIASEPPVDPAAAMRDFRRILGEAEQFVLRMPTEKAGLLFFKDGVLAQPDPERIHEYETHAGQRRGHWPGSLDIDSTMLEDA